MKQEKCDGMGDLDKHIQKDNAMGDMSKNVKMPPMPKAMPMEKTGGGGMKGGMGGMKGM